MELLELARLVAVQSQPFPLGEHVLHNDERLEILKRSRDFDRLG
jgi:hypothetical protein